MKTLLDLGLTNAILATILALMVAGIAFLCRRRPVLVHALWLLVLLKFLVPPVYPIEVRLPWKWERFRTKTEPVISRDVKTTESNNSDFKETPGWHAFAAPDVLTGKPPQVAGGLKKTFLLSPVRESMPPHSDAAGLTATKNSAMATSDPALDAAERHGFAAPDVQSETSLLFGGGMPTPPRPPLGLPDSPGGGVGMAQSTAPQGNTAEPEHWFPPVSWQAVIGGIWISGSLAWLAIAGVRIYRFQKMLRYAKPAGAMVGNQARMLADRLGMRRCPEILFIPAPVSPMVWALGCRARLLIPSALWGRLTEEQRQTLLIHELAHLRRGDHWVRRLELVVTALYWWHPVVWWAQQQLRQAEEQCCDAWVAWALPAAGQTYATTLVETLAFLSNTQPALPLGASGIEQVQQLKRRLAMIMTGTSPRAMSRAGFWVVLGLGILMLPLVPTSARPQLADQDQDYVPDQQPAVNVDPGQDQVADQQPGVNSDPGVVPDRPLKPPLTSMPARPWPADLAEQFEAARDEAELLVAQLQTKRAEIGEAETQMRHSERTWARLNAASEKGAASEELVNQARGDLDLKRAQLETKRAQLHEFEVRVKQAARRVDRLQARLRSAGGAGMGGGGQPLRPGTGALGAAGRPGGGEGAGVGAAGGPGSGLGGIRGPGGAATAGAMGPGGPPGALAGPAGGGPGRGAPGMMGGGPGGRMGAMGGGGQGGMMGDMMGRMMGMDGGQGMIDARGMLAPGPRLLEDLFEERSWDFGTVRRGERLTHSFQLTNDLSQMVEIKDVRVSAGFITARANGKQLAPGASATINVQMDTNRFSGDKTSSIYVQFAQPWQATVQLQIQADSRDNAMGMMGGMSMQQKDSQAKIVELEKKVDMLIEQMDGLRNELAKQRVNKPSREAK